MGQGQELGSGPVEHTPADWSHHDEIRHNGSGTKRRPASSTRSNCRVLPLSRRQWSERSADDGDDEGNATDFSRVVSSPAKGYGSARERTMSGWRVNAQKRIGRPTRLGSSQCARGGSERHNGRCGPVST
jgi:hypothetical protein